jgi:hypothetical protein
LRAGAALGTLSSWACSERSEHSDSTATRRGEARCAGGARLLRWHGCAKEQGEGAWGLHAGALDLLRAAGRDGRARSRRGKKNGATRAARTQRTHTAGERIGKGREDGASSPRRTSGGAPAGRGSSGGSARSEGEIVARKWATSGRNCASGGCFSLKNRTAGSFWKKHSASCAWDRLGGGGRRAGRVFLTRTSGCVRATRAGHWAPRQARARWEAGGAGLGRGHARAHEGGGWHGGPSGGEKREEGGGWGGPARPKDRGEQGCGPLYLFLLFQKMFSLFFLFTPFDSIPNMPQIQAYASNKSGVQGST